MATGLNKVMLIGNLGQDPEVRFTAGGLAICNFSIAINERKKDGEEWVEHVEWVRIACFGKTAENVGKYMEKGKSVHVEGKIQTRSYEKDGEKKWSTEVIASNVLFLSGQGGEQKQSASPAAKKSNGGKKPPQEKDEAFYDDDLPF